MDHCEKLKRKSNPREKANIISLLTFGYTGKLFGKALKNDLEEDDLYEVIKSCNSKKCGDNLEKLWTKEKKRKSPSMVHLLWVGFGVRYLCLGMIHLCWKLIDSILEPDAMGKLVAYFKPGQTDLSKNDAIYYGGVIIGLKLFHCFYLQNYIIYLQHLAIQIRTAFCSLIYRKSMKLSPISTMEDVNLGNIITLITKDVVTFEHSIWLLNDFWISACESAVLCYLIYNKVGLASFIGVGTLFCLMPLQMLLGKCISSMRLKINKKTDERLQITQETLSAIKIIKMYTWEIFFERKVGKARKKEMKILMKTFYIKMVTIIAGILSSKLGFYILVMAYVWLGNEISGEIIFYVLSCFEKLKHNVGIIMPIGLGRAAELYASLTRIKRVLLAPELSPESPEVDQQVIKPKIDIDNLSITIKGKDILKKVKLHLSNGLAVVTGPLGCGKSSLLKAILLDYPATEGMVRTEGRTSYASQDPWLFPSTIKQNILFGQPLNKERYREVIRVCSLEYDFDLLERGDETIVADRGLNLSKGQQARINLARAVYKESDIYLLDDSLTALDAHVQEDIFRDCIKGFLKNKLVVLVTHNPQHLEQADNIVVLDNGTVKISGNRGEITPSVVYHFIDDFKKVDEEVVEEKTDEAITEKTKLLQAKPFAQRKVYSEVKQKGSVKLNVYGRYFHFGGGFFVFGLIAFLYFISQFTESYSHKLVSKWVNIQENVTSIRDHNGTNSTGFNQAVKLNTYTINLYSIMILTSSAMELIKNYFLLNFARKASVNVHKSMVSTLVHSVMSFFDSYFIGNILNRFSQDLNVIDEHLPFTLMTVVRVVFSIGGVIILIASVSWTFLIPCLGFLLLLVVLRYIYMPTARSLKRLEASTRSPLVGHLNASMEGVTTIRAYKAEHILSYEFDRHQDLYTSANYTSFCTKRAFGFYMDSFSVVFTACIIARFLLLESDSTAGDVGLAITQASHLASAVRWGVLQWTEMENLMTAVERVLEYTHLKTESVAGQTIENWPKGGAVEFEGVSLTYSNTNEQVLKNVSFSVNPADKIGIVGRTGAGKSSIISTLFRLYDFDGHIYIDTIDTKTLSLNFLRQNIAIIPQDPILFDGTIRTNIDPLGKLTDDEIWQAIDRVKMKSLIPTLDLEISGTNFSTGQRQLLCLARAIVRKNKLVVLDEATANMDPETDALIQITIKENFADCTVFTIAHRLNSVMDCHQVIVMEKGRIIESGKPSDLVKDDNSAFCKMTKQSSMVETVDPNDNKKSQ